MTIKLSVSPGQKPEPRIGYVVYKFNIRTLELKEYSWCETLVGARAEAKKLIEQQNPGTLFTFGCCTAEDFDVLKVG